MRILAAGHDELLKALEISLGAESFHVYGTDTADEAIDLGKLYEYDAIVLAETDESIAQVLRSLRAARVKTPVLALMNGPLLPWEVAPLLDMGADDVMRTPCNVQELVARLNSIVRRSRGHAQSVLTAGPLALNISSKTATVHGEPLHLTGKQYAMVELLMLRKGMVQSKEAFLNYLYGGLDEPELKIIDVFICKLRAKLAERGAEGLIETIWGRGYIIREPQSGSPSMAPEIRDLTTAPAVARGHDLDSGQVTRRQGAA